MNLHRNISRSKLVRLLSDLASVEVESSKQDVAERLGLWLDAVGTVRLDAALQSIQTFAPQRPGQGLSANAAAVEAEFQHVRSSLVKAIKASLPLAPVEPDGETAVEYATYYQRYQEQQRQIESKLAPLRSQVRQVLSRASTQLRQLAALDALMEQMLGAREQKLMASVPVFLERRFEQLRKADQPGWLDTFRKEWQGMLVAEVDVRLQPVLGLIEALSNEVKKHP